MANQKASSEYINIIEDNIFDRLYQEAKNRNSKKQFRSQIQTECSFNDSKYASNLKNEKVSTESKKIITTPSFHLNSNTSPLASVDRMYPPSPEVDSEQTSKFLTNMQMYSSAEFMTQPKPKLKDYRKYGSNGKQSPAEFITWNESKYNSHNMDDFDTMNKARLKNEARLK